jgi:hypothetical protein
VPGPVLPPSEEDSEVKTIIFIKRRSTHNYKRSGPVTHLHRHRDKMKTPLLVILLTWKWMNGRANENTLGYTIKWDSKNLRS